MRAEGVQKTACFFFFFLRPPAARKNNLPIHDAPANRLTPHAHNSPKPTAHYIGSKILGTRLWPGPPPADPSAPPRPWAVALADDPGKAVLLVSQFTLLGSVRRGTKPDFGRAARPEPAAALFDGLVDRVRVALSGDPARVQTGVFGAMMEVSLVNDGPVTLTLDSRTVGPRKDN